MASRDELIRMLHHVQYEIRHCMLIPEWRDDAHILKEAVFLSFFVHARALIHFFQRKQSRWPDDVFSSDFGFTPACLSLPSDVDTRFGKDMMHITWQRLRHTQNPSLGLSTRPTRRSSRQLPLSWTMSLTRSCLNCPRTNKGSGETFSACCTKRAHR